MVASAKDGAWDRRGRLNPQSMYINIVNNVNVFNGFPDLMALGPE
jgi:hypothetical protein